MVRAEELSSEAIGRFVAASKEVRFEAEDRQQIYGWVEPSLRGLIFIACLARSGGTTGITPTDQRESVLLPSHRLSSS
jgi:hypothetical protein